jgi:YHS domain-containing protein
MQRKCLECGDTIEGRIDKKFCSDQCRNYYNNKLNSDSINYVRKVNNVLRKNRRILTNLNPSGKNKVTKGQLAKEGFEFDYFTNIYQTKQGKTYYFCYEQGYLQLEDDWYALVVKQEYVK